MVPSFSSPVILAGMVCAATRSVDHKSWKHGAKEGEVVALQLDGSFVTLHSGVGLQRHFTRWARGLHHRFVEDLVMVTAV